MPISYFNPKQEIRLSAYADTIVLEPDGREQRLRAIRFGGYPEMVRAMSDAIYAGATLETEFAGEPAMLACEPKKYECHLSHDGISVSYTHLGTAHGCPAGGVTVWRRNSAVTPAPDGGSR